MNILFVFDNDFSFGNDKTVVTLSTEESIDDVKKRIVSCLNNISAQVSNHVTAEFVDITVRNYIPAYIRYDRMQYAVNLKYVVWVTTMNAKLVQLDIYKLDKDSFNNEHSNIVSKKQLSHCLYYTRKISLYIKGNCVDKYTDNASELALSISKELCEISEGKFDRHCIMNIDGDYHNSLQYEKDFRHLVYIKSKAQELETITRNLIDSLTNVDYTS